MSDQTDNLSLHEAAQDALQISEIRYRRLFEAAPDGILILDAVTRKITDANQFMVELLGYSLDEFIGKELWEIGLLKDKETSKAAFRELQETGYIRYGGLRLEGKTGKQREVEFISNVYGEGARQVIQCNIRDITGRRLAEIALQQQQAELRVLFDLLPAMIWFKDTENNILRVNQHVVDSIGKTIIEIEGKSAFEIYPQEADKFYADDLEVIRSGKPKLGIIETLQVKDGRQLWVQTDKVPYRNVDGKVSGLVVMARDVTERKRLADALRRSEANLANAQRIAHIGSWETNLQSGELFWSDEVYQIFGVSKNEFGATLESFVNFIHPEDRQMVQAASTATLKHGAPYNIEHRIITKDGVERVVCEIGEVVFDDSGKPLRMTGTVQDITERKQAEESLRESEDRYRLLFESNPLPLWVYDLETLKFLAVNDAAIVHYGYSQEEFLSMTIMDIRPPEDRAALLEHISGASDVLDEAGEWKHRRKDGSVIVVQLISHKLAFDGRPAELVLANDLTERKSAEDALFQAESKYRNIVESMPAIVYLAQPYPPYSPIYVSPNITVFGYQTEEWFSQPDLWVSLIHEEDRERVLSATESAMRQNTETDLEYRIVGCDKKIHWVHDQGHFISDENGNKIGWQGVILDITATKELEEQLRQSQKLESVGRLAGGIAHDFNNMLTVISGYSDIALARVGENDPLRRYIEEIKKAGQRSASLTQQLLAFSRQQILQPAVVNLNEAITDILKMLQRLIGENVQLVAALNPKTGRVKVDPGQLSQIIMNLAVNASDAMPDGGHLTIETANVFFEPNYTGRHVKLIPGAYVMLSVRDTGIGIDKETQQNIFEPFFTTKEVGKGTGLGLATVYGIVKQSGGDIEVLSEVGRGTIFKIFLPRVAQPIETTEVELNSSELPRGTETILLVEDEDVVRSLTCEVLQMCGYNVLEARDGVEALTICERHDCEISLLMTDVVMPRMGGWELAEKFALVYPQMRVLFTSGYTNDVVARRDVIGAMSNFIQKPFALDALAHKVRAVLDAPLEP